MKTREKRLVEKHTAPGDEASTLSIRSTIAYISRPRPCARMTAACCCNQDSRT